MPEKRSNHKQDLLGSITELSKMIRKKNAYVLHSIGMRRIIIQYQEFFTISSYAKKTKTAGSPSIS